MKRASHTTPMQLCIAILKYSVLGAFVLLQVLGLYSLVYGAANRPVVPAVAAAAQAPERSWIASARTAQAGGPEAAAHPPAPTAAQARPSGRGALERACSRQARPRDVFAISLIEALHGCG